jgi:hypothetical protein
MKKLKSLLSKQKPDQIQNKIQNEQVLSIISNNTSSGVSSSSSSSTTSDIGVVSDIQEVRL